MLKSFFKKQIKRRKREKKFIYLLYSCGDSFFLMENIHHSRSDQRLKNEGYDICIWKEIAIRAWEDIQKEGYIEKSHYFRNNYLNQRFIEIFKEEYKKWINIFCDDKTILEIKEKTIELTKKDINRNEAIEIVIDAHKYEIMDKIDWDTIEKRIKAK